MLKFDLNINVIVTVILNSVTINKIKSDFFLAFSLLVLIWNYIFYIIKAFKFINYFPLNYFISFYLNLDVSPSFPELKFLFES